MMRIRLKAPNGKLLRHLLTDRLYSEVICDEKRAAEYVVADSADDPTMQTIDGVTLDERVSDLEDAVIELAEIIGGE